MQYVHSEDNPLSKGGIQHPEPELCVTENKFDIEKPSIIPTIA